MFCVEYLSTFPLGVATSGDAGLGQTMMTRLLHIAERVGLPVMGLTVQKANRRALALYRKMGFRIVREQVRGQVEELAPEPEVYMERETH